LKTDVVLESVSEGPWKSLN